MPTRDPGANVARRRLGTALRGLRESANLRVEAAARELECSTAKISRLENGLGPAKTWEVRVLLDFYGVRDDRTRARLDRLVTGTKSTGWWEPDADVVDDDAARYLGVETESTLVRMYCTPVLPVLLQSHGYALAHVRDRHPELSSDETRRLAEIRRTRQQELLSPANPLKLVAIVEEGAIHRQVGSPQIHAESLTWLADLLDGLAEDGRDDVTLYILPFTAGTPDRAMSAFTLFAPREPDLDPVTACVEDFTGATWFESDEDVAVISATFDRLRARCLDPIRSRALLRESVTFGGRSSFSGHAPAPAPEMNREGTT